MEFCKNCGSIEWVSSSLISYRLSIDKQGDFEMIETDRD